MPEYEKIELSAKEWVSVWNQIPAVSRQTDPEMAELNFYFEDQDGNRIYFIVSPEE